MAEVNDLREAPGVNRRLFHSTSASIVEIHLWNSTMEDVERPNRIVWDLDPGPAVTWKQIVKAAGLVRAVRCALGLAS